MAAVGAGRGVQLEVADGLAEGGDGAGFGGAMSVSVPVAAVATVTGGGARRDDDFGVVG